MNYDDINIKSINGENRKISTILGVASTKKDIQIRIAKAWAVLNSM